MRAGRALAPLPVGTWTTALAPRRTTPLVVARPRRRLRRTVASVATLAVGVVLGGAVLQLVSGPAAPVTASATGAGERGVVAEPATPSPDHVQVDPAAYLGRPLADVQGELLALGLLVQVSPETSTTVPPDGVVSVTPNGALTRGDTVLVTYAAAPAAPAVPVVPVAPSPAPASPATPVTEAVQRAPAPVVVPAPAPVVHAPVPPVPRPPAPAPAPGKGGGKGGPGKGGPGKGGGKGGKKH